MFKKIATNQELLKAYLDIISQKNNFKKTSDVFVQLLKMSQDERSLDSLLEKPEKQIIHILSSLEPFESKEAELSKILKDNLGTFHYYLMSKVNNPELENWLLYYLGEVNNFIKNNLILLSKYNGKNASAFKMRGMMHNMLDLARVSVEGQKMNKERDEAKYVSHYDKDNTIKDKLVGESIDDIIEKNEQYQNENTDLLSSTEAKLSKLEQMFNQVLNDPASDILAYEVENVLYPYLVTLKENYDTSLDEQSILKNAKDIDAFFEQTVEYIEKKYSTRKRNPNTNAIEAASLSELQVMVNNVVDSLDNQGVIDQILSQQYYKLPKMLKYYLESFPQVTKLLLKSAIKTLLLFNTKQELNVSLPASTKGGGPLAISDYLAHVLQREIKLLQNSDEEKQEIYELTLKMLKLKNYTREGQHPTAGIKFLDLGLFSHITPLVYAGLMKNYLEQHQEELTPDQQIQIVNQIHSLLHTNALMPHTTKRSKYVNNMSRINNTPESELRNHILKRLRKADEIQRGRATPYTFLDDEDFGGENEDNEVNASSNILSKLIQKYAFKN